MRSSHSRSPTWWHALATPLPLFLIWMLSACGSAPPAPDWQMNSRASAERAAQAWLNGLSQVEALEFSRARNELARTGQPALMARLELMRCATRVASLTFEPCLGYEVLAGDAAQPERTYARYLAGQAQAVDAPLLPQAHRPLVQAAPAAQETALGAIQDPLSRLIGAAVLVRRGQASPAVVKLAVDTASAQGWRRSLLAWLGLQLRQAQTAGDTEEAARVQRRIDLLGR